MTVKELRELLATLPDDMPVWHEYDMSTEDDVAVYRAVIVGDNHGDSVLLGSSHLYGHEAARGEVCIISPPASRYLDSWARAIRVGP
jgi:hypothetical protein